jgi:hypothetical protein
LVYGLIFFLADALFLLALFALSYVRDRDPSTASGFLWEFSNSAWSVWTYAHRAWERILDPLFWPVLTTGSHINDTKFYVYEFILVFQSFVFGCLVGVAIEFLRIGMRKRRLRAVS